MKREISDYIGKRYGKLVVLGKSTDTHFNSNTWMFKCDCGTIFTDIPARVLSGHRKSCGCLKKTQLTSHGCGKNEYYHGWWSMMQRCYNPKHHNYHRYGGRGITVCEEWHDPAVFCSWAEKTNGKKRNGLSLDRIDNDKGYYPDNCKWSTPAEQSDNRRNTVKVEVNGQIVPLSKIVKGPKRNLDRTRARIKDLGWSVEDALEKELVKPNIQENLKKSRESAPVK